MVEQFNEKLQKQFAKMCSFGKLFRVKLTGREVWDKYLLSFSKENNPVFRDPESTVHNCNHCKNFVRRYGNIVALDENGNIITLFDFSIDGEFGDTVKVLSKYIKSSKIENVFLETFDELNSLPYGKCRKASLLFRLGVDKNVKRYTKEESELYGVVKPNEIKTFGHIYLDLPKEFVDMSGKSIEAIMSEYRDKYSVFKRGMEEISLDTLELVQDLIIQDSLLDGAAHLDVLEAFIVHKQSHTSIDLNASKVENWYWDTTYSMSERIAKFKNTLIGVLCSELSEGEEINKACQSWNKRVDPVNYMKVTSPITQKQIADAKEFVEGNGYTESFSRRFATLDDMKISEVLHSNVGDGSIKDVSIFDDIKSTKSRHKRNQFDNIEEVGIEKFMSDILPSCSSIEAYFGNSHINNLVTLTTANIADSKPIFKWSNNYSWTFNGNWAGKSQIKEAVKAKGGNVGGDLRFSIMWAEKDGDNSDLDAWCRTPNGFNIGFSSKHDGTNGGVLDIDITQPQSQMPNGAVENITFPDLLSMTDGVYKFWVNQYAGRNSKGFKAEIEFNGETYSYEYSRGVKYQVQVAEVLLKRGEFTIKHLLPESCASKEAYGLETNQFQKVNLVCLSPNHWGDNNTGNKHYLFMLDGCKTPVPLRSFHNENLISDLLKHRKVMDTLGSTNRIEPSDKQLSGLGFNATVRDELIVKLSGNFKRMLKIKF